MAISESQAALRWCPFARMRWAKARDEGTGWQTTNGDSSFNRVALKYPSDEILVTRCVGSECMAWRPAASVIVGTERVLNGLTGYTTVVIREETGDCGLVAPDPSAPSAEGGR